MEKFFEGLNDVQRDAVKTIDGPTMVVAGPGSGKTRVLTSRIAYMIFQGIPPHQILALTFTNKAAKEMKERIYKVIGDQAFQVWAGTFHSIFARILRIECEKIGFAKDFTIYDSDDSKNLVAAIIKDMKLDDDVYQANAIRNRISSCKSNLITPKMYAMDEKLKEQDRAAKKPYLVDIYTTYVARCQRSGAMDFDDLLYQMFRLLQQHPETLEKYRARFPYVLVDEFQDTNYLQYAILKKLCLYEGSAQNICVVGDDAQSIYGFRGATIENILDFEKDFNNLKVFKLEQNYRSIDSIVKAANDLISNNTRQIQKEIWTSNDSTEKIKLVSALADTEEARRVVDFILEQKNRNHLPNRDIAILYRTNAQSRIFEEYLRRANIIYKVFGGLSFYQRKEVKDMLAYMRLSVNQNDDEAFRRIVNYPRRGLGQSSLEKIMEFALHNNCSYWDAIKGVDLPNRAKSILLDFAKMILDFKDKSATLDAYELANHIAQKSGVLNELKGDKTIEGIGRIENIVALLDGVKEFVDNDELLTQNNIEDKTLTSYLQSIALVSDLDNLEEDADYVTLMSVHASKGLEFQSVFVVGMEEGLFPSQLSINEKNEIDEERRLFYVAITRAKKYLTLSYAKSRYRFGQMKQCEPSRFLLEIDAKRFESTNAIKTSIAPSTTVAVKSGLSGFYKPISKPQPVNLGIDIADFKASPTNQLAIGQAILHNKFGKGKILKIDGANDNRVATIKFDDLDDPERRIMLRFANLMILN